MLKRRSRLRRAKKTRAKIRQLEFNRLNIFRSSQHIYAQIISPEGKIVASASTVEKKLNKDCKSNGSNIAAASLIGKTIAQRATKAKVEKVAFDRSGFAYHGRVKALAEAARDNGLTF